MVFAQDYQTVRSDFVRFFSSETNQGTNYHGIKIDSVEAVGNDSVFYNYWHVRQWESDCELQPYTPSFLGRKIVVRPNGQTLFFNHAEDTIAINETASLNDSWEMMKLDGGLVVQAQVVDISNQVLLDSNIQVKTIQLSVLDSLGNVISHPSIDHDTIQISDKLGIIRSPDFHLFPDQIVTFQMAGMEKPHRGMHRVGCPHDFLVEVGDEFHRYSENDPLWSENFTSAKRIDVVISTSLNSNIQTINWEVVKQTFQFPAYTYTSEVYADTSYLDVSSMNEPCNGQMPNESVYLIDTIGSPDPNHYPFGIRLRRNRYGTSFCGRPSLTTSGNDLETFIPDTLSSIGCYEMYPFVSESTSGSTQTTYELGNTYSSITYNTGGGSGGSYSTLKYFKHAGEECGNPYTVSQLLSTDEIEQSEFKIYPNPIVVGQTLQVLNFKNSTVKLLSINGKQIPIEIVNGSIKTDNLVPGIYLIQIETETGVSTQKLVVTE